ncbi:hypothetical protein K8942_05605 [Candidatus Peribacteria bacterium]|nr:MAG: hypothetical protein K8942_05605 [Candidatus Peribacteria bacterium]
MSERTYRLVLGVAALFLAAWILFPFVRYASYPDYQGLVPLRTGDDGAYYDRIQTALLGRFDEVSNGITGPGIQGVGSASVEFITGFLLQGTGLRGPEAGVLLMVLIAPLFFVFFSLFLRRLGVSARMSLLLTALYTVMVLGSLQRPVNLSFTLPYTALVLLVFANARSRGGMVRCLLAALLIGVLPGVYFWAWTFLWAACACVLLLQFIAFPRSGTNDVSLRRLIGMGTVTFLVALPLLFQTWVMQVTSSVFSDVASYRSGLYPSHAIESPERAVLLLLLVIASLTIFIRRKDLREVLLVPVSLVISAFVVMHQNVIHGKDLMLSSHYYPFVCLAAVAMAATVLAHDPVRLRTALVKWPSTLVLIITSILLVAGFWDYRITWKLPFAKQSDLNMQYLAPALRHLTDGTRHAILSDGKTSLLVAAWTDDSVVFTPYVQSLLVSDADYIRRSCLSQLFHPAGPDTRAIAWELTQFRGEHLLDVREAEVRSLCTTLFLNPRAALEAYNVDLLLWNETLYPLWTIDPTLFEKTESGNGWSLWALRSR